MLVPEWGRRKAYAPDVLDVLTTLLRIEGADVAGAGSGHEAMTVFRSRHFDVARIGLRALPVVQHVGDW